MPDLTDDEHKQVLGEVLADQLKLLQEGIANLPTKDDFSKLDNKVDILSLDMKTVKAAVTDQNKQVQDHEQRITVLETA